MRIVTDKQLKSKIYENKVKDKQLKIHRFTRIKS